MSPGNVESSLWLVWCHDNLVQSDNYLSLSQLSRISDIIIEYIFPPLEMPDMNISSVALGNHPIQIPSGKTSVTREKRERLTTF